MPWNMVSGAAGLFLKGVVFLCLYVLYLNVLFVCFVVINLFDSFCTLVMNFWIQFFFLFNQ